MSKQKGLSFLKVCFLVLIVGLVANLFLPSSNISNSSNPITKELTQPQKTELCKEYIASLFYKSKSIMKAKFIKNDLNVSFIEISYVREFDNTVWKYVCSISDKVILWAAVLEDGNLGRWRYEDEVEIRDGKLEL